MVLDKTRASVLEFLDICSSCANGDQSDIVNDLHG